jgi:hypothetical protein
MIQFPWLATIGYQDKYLAEYGNLCKQMSDTGVSLCCSQHHWLTKILISRIVVPGTVASDIYGVSGPVYL